LYTRRGRSLELSGHYEEALACYAEMLDTARSRGDRGLELAALIAQTTARSAPTRLQDLTLAQELSVEALVLARALDDPAAEAKILWNRSLMGYFMGQPGQAVADGEQAIAIARRLGLREQLAYALHDIARSYVALGQLERGRSSLEEAETLWRELGNKQLLADCLNGTVEVYAMAGDYERCLAIADESIRLSKEIGNHWGLAYSAALKGMVLAERAEYAAAIACLNESLELAQLSGFAYPFVIARLPLVAIYYTAGVYGRAQDEINLATDAAKLLPIPVLPAILASLALVQLATGDRAAARATARRSLEGIALDDATVAGLALAAPLPWIADIEIRLADGDLDTLLATADRMLTGVRRFRIRPFLSDALYAMGRVLLALGRAEEAWNALDEARAEASAIGCRRALWRILETMSTEAVRRGDNESALSLAEQARQVIDTIAAHAGSEELRDSFLGLPQVKRVLALAGAHDAGF
jgi:tetratricopeptide (TPR) repeat protein